MLTLVRSDSLGLHKELVAENANEVYRDGEISSDEVLVVKVSVFRAPSEDIEVLGQGNQDAEEKCEVRTTKTQRGNERHLLVRDALSPPGLDEEYVRNQERNPGAKTKDGHQVDEVAENFRRVLCGVHESAAAEKR